MKAEKIIRPFGTGQITIPVEFRRRLKIGPDTLLKIILREDGIEVKPLQLEEGERPLRDYSVEEIEQLVADDKLDPLTAAKVKKLLS